MSAALEFRNHVVDFYFNRKEYIDKWARNQDGTISIDLVVYAQVIQEDVKKVLNPLLDFSSATHNETVSVGGGDQ